MGTPGSTVHLRFRRLFPWQGATSMDVTVKLVRSLAPVDPQQVASLWPPGLCSLRSIPPGADDSGWSQPRGRDGSVGNQRPRPLSPTTPRVRLASPPDSDNDSDQHLAPLQRKALLPDPPLVAPAKLKSPKTELQTEGPGRRPGLCFQSPPSPRVLLPEPPNCVPAKLRLASEVGRRCRSDILAAGLDARVILTTQNVATKRFNE